MKKETFFFFLLAACLFILAYWPGLSGPFLFDDYPNIIENDRLISIQDFRFSSIRAAISQEEPGPLGRSIGFVTFALNIASTGLDPYWFKLTNFAIHLLAGLALVSLLGILTKTALTEQRPDLIGAISLATAAAWLVHPFNLTSVLYIVQRQAELSALFALLSMLLYSLARQRQIEGRPGAPLFYALLPISFIMGIFSKENGVLIPGYLFLLEICFFRFRAQRPAVTAWLKRICLTAIVLALPLALYAFYHFGSYQHRDFTLTERLLTQSRVIWFYLQSILLPDIRAMTIFHDDFQLSRSLLDPASTLFAIGGVAFLVGAAVALRKRAPVLSFGILFYFMSHALESTFIALEMVHEHRNYLGSWGLIWAFFHYFFVFAYRYQRKGIAIALSCAIIGVLAVNTRIRADYWSNELLLVEYHVHHHPASFRSLVSAGGAYASYGNALRNEEALRKALDYYHRADQLRPSTSAPLIAIVGLLVVLGEEDQLPKYEIRLAENLSQRPIDTETMNAFVVVSRCLGKVKDCTFPQRVYRNMAESLLRNPNLNNVNSQTAAQIYSANSNFAYMDGHIEQALAYNENALKIHPTDLQHWLNQAMLLGMAGRTADAMAQLDKARGIDTTSYGRERIDAVARQLTQN